MKIFNTLTRKKEELTGATPREISLYCCGPTVYNYIHIGNARPLIVFDVLRRHLMAQGIKVRFVQNFTDIDDKVIQKANAEGVTYQEIAARYIEEFLTDARGLGVQPPDVTPRATESIPAILDIITKLFARGFAYELPDGVYYRVKNFDEYGKLSHQPLDDLLAGARIETDEGKESPMDFCLWKRARPGEPAWPSPWGDGRPGWHIECSAMVKEHVGDTVDIHCGGQDLIFPHHENEIAQSEAAHGVPFARYWMHNGFLSIDNCKMSKSLGNFLTVRDAATAFGYEPIRLFMLTAHYRSPLNYSEESLQQAVSALARIRATQENLAFLLERTPETDAADTAWTQRLAQARARFDEALSDDLNTADALGTLFELIKDINIRLAENPTRADMEAAAGALMGLLEVLGLSTGAQKEDLDAEIEALIAARQTARQEKNFKEADRIRDTLKERNILLEDTPQGVKWRRA